MEDITTRVVQIWLDDSYMEVEVNQPDDWDEDTLYHEICDYVILGVLTYTLSLIMTWNCCWIG